MSNNHADERTPLLENGADAEPPKPFFRRVLDNIFKENPHQPSWAASLRFFFFGSYFNYLLVFVPLSFLAHHLNWDAQFRFWFSFGAILPLAGVCPFVLSQ